MLLFTAISEKAFLLENTNLSNPEIFRKYFMTKYLGRFFYVIWRGEKCKSETIRKNENKFKNPEALL